MKKGSFIITLMLIIQTVFSQKKDSCYAGVYLTKKDFLENKLSYKINEGIKGNKTEFSFPADLTLTLKIVTPDSIIKFKPGCIYGYYECGNVFRYFHGIELNVQEDYYKIEEAKGLIIYSSVFIAGNEFFFSTDLVSTIHRLTMKNLGKEFKDHPDFINCIKEIKNEVNDGLAERDEKGYFMINKIYQATIGQHETKTNR